MINKRLRVIFLNIAVLICIFFIAEFIVYKYASISDGKYYTKLPGFSYKLSAVDRIIYINELKDYFNDKNNHTGRKPVGIQYKSKPIVIFGCSFGVGQYLQPDKNFGYKLSQKLKRPVYNRAVSGAGIQHMYYQVSDKFANTFFEQVPETDTVYYILIDDHFMRMSVFSDYDIIGRNYHLRYHIKNNIPILDNYNNIFINFLKQSYIVRFLNLKYLKWKINSDIFADRLTNDMLVYFIKTRERMERHWNNKIKFNVVFYDFDTPRPFIHKELLKKKLEENGFNVIDTKDLTDVNLKSDDYFMSDNYHPKEAAWNILTDKIIEKSQL